jgi:hypothetical protein
MTYQFLVDSLGNVSNKSVLRVADNACIPFDPANTCYQAFLAWKAEGNEPLPADEPTK